MLDKLIPYSIVAIVCLVLVFGGCSITVRVIHETQQDAPWRSIPVQRYTDTLRYYHSPYLVPDSLRLGIPLVIPCEVK